MDVRVDHVPNLHSVFFGNTHVGLRVVNQVAHGGHALSASAKNVRPRLQLDRCEAVGAESSGPSWRVTISRLIAGGNGKSERLPVVDTGFEPVRTQASGTQQPNGVGSQHAERSAALSDAFPVPPMLGKTTLQLLHADRKCVGALHGPMYFNLPAVRHY